MLVKELPIVMEKLSDIKASDLTLIAQCACGHSSRLDTAKLAACLGDQFKVGWLKYRLRCAMCKERPDVVQMVARMSVLP